MYLVDTPPQNGAALTAYRTALVDAYDSPTLRRLCLEIEVTIPHRIVFEQPLADLVDKLLDVARQEGWLRRLLILALRRRAGNEALVHHLASRLDLAPLIALAKELSTICPLEALTAAIGTLDQRLREQAPTGGYHSDCGVWIDRLVWLDELSPRRSQSPPLILVISHILSRLAPQGTEANLLRTRLDTMRVQFGIVTSPQPAEASTSYSILIELIRSGPNWGAETWSVCATGRSVKLFDSTFNACENERELKDALARVVDQCFLNNIFNLHNGPLPLRFEFALPKECLGLAVDQIRVGGGKNQEPSRLATDYPVTIRPHSWCRPEANVRRTLQDRLTRKRLHMHEGKSRVDVVATPGAWGPDSKRHAQEDDELAGIVLAFDDLAQTGSVVEQLLQTQVLAVLWPRSSCATPCDEVGQQYLRSLIEGVRDAPARVFAARRKRDGAGQHFKDHLSLIWYGDPVDLPPAADLSAPPLQP